MTYNKYIDVDDLTKAVSVGMNDVSPINSNNYINSSNYTVYTNDLWSNTTYTYKDIISSWISNEDDSNIIKSLAPFIKKLSKDLYEKLNISLINTSIKGYDIRRLVLLVAYNEDIISDKDYIIERIKNYINSTLSREDTTYCYYDKYNVIEVSIRTPELDNK